MEALILFLEAVEDLAMFVAAVEGLALLQPLSPQQLEIASLLPPPMLSPQQLEIESPLSQQQVEIVSLSLSPLRRCLLLFSCSRISRLQRLRIRLAATVASRGIVCNLSLLGSSSGCLTFAFRVTVEIR